MSERIDGGDDNVPDTKRDSAGSLSTSVANSRNRTSSHLEHSHSESQPSRTLSTQSAENMAYAEDTGSQNNPNFHTEPLDPQNLYHRDNDLRSVGSWDQPQKTYEPHDCSSRLHSNSIHTCSRHSSVAEATCVPTQQLSPHERWVAEDISDGSACTVERFESRAECSCISLQDM